MPDITIDIVIPEANVTEVSEATGATTREEFRQWVRNKVKDAVRQKRANDTRETERAKVVAAKEAEDTAVQTAVNAVDTDVVLG